MSLFTQLFTALKGGVTETAQAAADQQALRILDQQLRDAKGNLKTAEFDLAGLMGRLNIAKDKLKGLEEKAVRDFATAQRAVDAGRVDLATELAEKIATVENEATRERGLVEALDKQATQLRGTVVQIRQRITDMEREVETVRVTESVQKAQTAIVASGSGAASTLNSAAESLARLKERQAQRSAHFQAAEELAQIGSGGDLERRLADAGLATSGGSGASVLARLKGPSTPALPGAATAALPAPSGRTDDA